MRIKDVRDQLEPELADLDFDFAINDAAAADLRRSARRFARRQVHRELQGELPGAEPSRVFSRVPPGG